MKKLVPDPPFFCTCCTVATSLGHCPEHPDLFCVTPGIGAEDTLVHAAILLKCAQLTCARTIDAASDEVRTLAQCTQQSVELARALIDALLGGLEQPTPLIA